MNKGSQNLTMTCRCWYLHNTAGGHSRKSIIPTGTKENTCSALSTMKAGTRMAHWTLDPTTLTSAPSHHFPGSHIKVRCSKPSLIRLRSERRWGFLPSSLPHSHESPVPATNTTGGVMFQEKFPGKENMAEMCATDAAVCKCPEGYGISWAQLAAI